MTALPAPSAPRIYYTDETTTLWHGDCRDVLPLLDERPVACVTDPPYGETVATWDVWPDGWVDAVSAALPASASMWFFGTTRMLLAHAAELTGWKYAQEALWAKRNGSGPGSRDRLNKVHEWAFHWYRGRWSDLHHEWERIPDEDARSRRGGHVVRKASRSAAHQRDGRETTWTDDGTRQPRSLTYIIEAPSVRNQKRHQDEKPVAVVLPLVRECTPLGGLVLDPFAGVGTTAIAARTIGRRTVLIEGDEKNCEVAARRLCEAELFDLAGAGGRRD